MRILSRAVLLGWCATITVGAGYLHVQAQVVVSQTAVSPRTTLDKYCVTCHNGRLKTAGLLLDQMDVAHIGDGAEVWEKVAHKLRTHEMPPRGTPRPDEATYSAMASWLETAVDTAAAAKPNPGRVMAHRLNRTEYANAIRDLLALEVDGRSLLPPDDRDQEGFDNIAGVLSISPVLMERYMAAAHTISRLAVGDPTIVPVFETFQIKRGLDQQDRVSEELPFESRAGITIRYHFPLDGEYVVKVRLRRQIYSYIIGMGFPHQLEVRLDGERIKVFTVGGEAKGQPAPATLTGNILGDTEWEKYLHEADAGLEVRLAAKAGTRVVGVSFIDNSHWEAEGVLQPSQNGTDYNSSRNEHYDGNPSVESVAIGGPYDAVGPGDTPSRRKIFVCRPSTMAEEEPCARKILSTLSRRAYRRPVLEPDVQTLVGFYKAGRREGSFDAGIQQAIERMLADPNFLFRAERRPEKVLPDTAYRLSDFELASRMSFFLWSSIPDDELLDLASRGKLNDPVVLEQQVRRMLGDTRSQALVDNFADQWLRVRDLSGVTPDPDLFPDFNENLRDAFRQETELFVGSQVREDHSVVDLLTANYTFLNEQLARHYGIANVYGSHFRRMTLHDEHRFGLLGQGSILTVTAYPNRTSPVLRGKWLLDNFLGSPPPAPPPDVPNLPDNTDVAKLSMRERMQAHRKNPVCASCHARMDALGFALENFDAIGRWRTTTDGGAPIDTAAALPDGTEFQGVSGLRKLLVSHRDEFAGAFTTKLLTYAIGRGVEFYDLPAIRKITRDAAANDYRWSSIILGIVKSVPFQMRRSEAS